MIRSEVVSTGSWGAFSVVDGVTSSLVSLSSNISLCDAGVSSVDACSEGSSGSVSSLGTVAASLSSASRVVMSGSEREATARIESDSFVGTPGETNDCTGSTLSEVVSE